MSEKSIPYHDFVRKLFNRSGDPSKDFAHAVLGVVTEIHEYLSATDAVNGLEELGDLEFYDIALHQVVADHLGGFVPPALVGSMERLDALASAHGASVVIANECNDLLDHAKRWVGYGKVPQDLPAVYTRASALILFTNLTGPHPCEDTLRIRKANTAKLLKRYPGGEFDAFRAVVRDLEAERGVLQAA